MGILIINSYYPVYCTHVPMQLLVRRKVSQSIFIFMLAATSITIHGSSVGVENDRLGEKRISKLELETDGLDPKLVNNFESERVIGHYGSPLVLGYERDESLESSEESDNFNIEKLKESPEIVLEMPLTENEAEQTLLDKINRKNTSKVGFAGHIRKSSETFTLPANYEYPEMVQSLKNVYKEMFITSSLYALNIVSAVGIVLVNKLIYAHYNFPHGIVLTLYHFVITSIGLQILAALKMFPVKPVNLLKVLPLSVSFCSYVVLTNLSLQYNSGTFYQVNQKKEKFTVLIFFFPRF